MTTEKTLIHVKSLLDSYKFKNYSKLQLINNCKLEFEKIVTEINSNILKIPN